MEEKEDRSDSYYQHWLAALEHLAIAKGLSEAGEMALRVHAGERLTCDTTWTAGGIVSPLEVGANIAPKAN